MKRIAILGSTGSIGQSTLDVVDNLNGEIGVSCLAAYSNGDALLQQALKYRPQSAVLVKDEIAEQLKRKFDDADIKLFSGESGLLNAIREDNASLVVNGIVGAAGLLPTVEAIQSGKDIAIANKETLVIAGEVITTIAKKHNVKLIPMDSEHNALFQCLVGESLERIEKIILTASGGPFFNRVQPFDTITVKEALAHPNWEMGRKITIDSSTLMNKGLEVIEAHWLFNMPVEAIEVVVHPQSIIHSMIEFIDGSFKAQLGAPDMRIPIQYALTYPDRQAANFGSVNFCELEKMTFYPPDMKKFPCLALAFEAIKMKGTTPVVLNAANEEAVYLFLNKEIAYLEIPQLIEKAMEAHQNVLHPELEAILEADRWARNFIKHQNKI